jgi:2,3-bisphosphoglycerate-dependent phosphoglycerate mutase
VTEIYLTRHGQSIHNLRQTIAGQLDSELTARGFEDARFVADTLGRSDFDVIYTSDSHRARQTVDTIIDTLNLTCPVIPTPLLRELNYGEFTNRPVAETFRILDYKVIQDRRYPEGESFQDLEKRVAQFMEYLRTEALGKRVLVTAHAGPIRMLVMLFDSTNRQVYLGQPFSNRYIGRIILNPEGKLLSYTTVTNPTADLI